MNNVVTLIKVTSPILQVRLRLYLLHQSPLSFSLLLFVQCISIGFKDTSLGFTLYWIMQEKSGIVH